MFSKYGSSMIVAGVLLIGVGLFFWSSEKKSPFSFVQGNLLKVAPETSIPVSIQPPGPLTLLFGGDLMFDRSIRTAMRKRGNTFPLEPLRETLTQADLVVANLEGPITGNASRSETSAIGARDNYFFTFDPMVAGVLHDFHIDAVNIGNNHILNFEEGGVRETEKYLSQAGVGFFGSPLAGDDRILKKEIRGVNIALVNYNQFVWQGKEKALADITSVKEQADIIILYTHWGTEYVPATPATKELAHIFVDAGADLIIGSHPHVVQEKEVYQGKTIYYSLGNLVFDQYLDQATRQGLLVRATYDPETRSFTSAEISVTLKSTGQTVLTEP